jgi:glycosyltransferase involved in cell wall biosynthesis
VEAMASGCVIIGYHGRGGKEFYRAEFCFPTETGNIIEVAKKVEQAIKLSEDNPQWLHDMAFKASEFIRVNYSPQAQKKDILKFWDEMLQI